MVILALSKGSTPGKIIASQPSPAATVETESVKTCNYYMQRAYDAEADALRLHKEKMDMYERAISAEGKLAAHNGLSAGTGDVHPVEKLWREVGLPEYFLGNGGTNTKLYALYDAIRAEKRPNHITREPVAYVPRSKAPGSEGEPLWREVFEAKWLSKGNVAGLRSDAPLQR
jgi:hypothetical protein